MDNQIFGINFAFMTINKHGGKYEKRIKSTSFFLFIYNRYYFVNLSWFINKYDKWNNKSIVFFNPGPL